MDKQIKELISKELEQFHCSILLEEVKETVRKLRSYGIDETKIETIFHDEVVFPQLVITKNFDIVLSREEKISVKMEPLVKAIYLLFLSHPEGILLKCLPDYRKELTELYLILRPTRMTDRIAKSVEDITNPTLNSINEKCTRIRRIFSDILPKSIAQYYYISGKRGGLKRIGLPLANVIWECKFPVSQGL
ncbi:MAG: hypothetical protein IJV27_10100 [Prevotella sp.]|nr:hypothetical protein [Prevotella sp.]